MINIGVTIGDAIDKLTILHIKQDQIKNSLIKQEAIQKEINSLMPFLEIFITKFKLFFDLLKEINLEIWELSDLVRYKYDSLDNSEKLRVHCRLLKTNEERFRIKSLLNELCQSFLREQKNYFGANCITLDGPIDATFNDLYLYLICSYDKVNILSKNTTIDSKISSLFDFTKDKFDKVIEFVNKADLLNKLKIESSPGRKLRQFIEKGDYDYYSMSSTKKISKN